MTRTTFVPSAQLIKLISDTQTNQLVCSPESRVLFFVDPGQERKDQPTEKQIEQWIRERLESTVIALVGRSKYSQEEIMAIDSNGHFTDKVGFLVAKWLGLNVSAEKFTATLNLLGSEFYQWATENRLSAKQLGLEIKDNGQFFLKN